VVPLLDKRDFLTLAHMRDVTVLSQKIETEGLPYGKSTKGESATRLRNHLIVGKAAKEIAATLGDQHCVIATARVRAGMKGNLLHPVATSPRQLNRFFLDPKEYANFGFSPVAFQGDSGTLFECGSNQWQGRVYNLKTLDARGKGESCFAWRISKFLAHIQAAPETYGLDLVGLSSLRETGICLVLGGIQSNTDFAPPRPLPDEFYYFFALYLVPKSTAKPVFHAPTDIGLYLTEMFRAIEISERADKEDFERDGLALVSELIPFLSNPDTAPSDAIAYLLKRMEGILHQHTLGIEDQHTWVRFVAINSILHPSDNSLTPRFQVFPHYEAAQAAIGAFLISHPKRLSTVKLIVREWARRSATRLSAEFEQLFSGVAVPDGVFNSDLKCACFSVDDGDLWKHINLDVTPDNRKTMCTLGFVIENRTTTPIVPYAIIAFESDLPDAFSRQDIVRFCSVIDACSSLLLGLHLSSATFDIKEKISFAFRDTSTFPAIGNRTDGLVSKIAFGSFRFELQRLDKTVLIDIIKSPNAKIWTGDGLSQADAESYIAEPLAHMPGAPDNLAGDQYNDDQLHITFDRILRERNAWIVKNEAKLHQLWDESGIALKLYEFLANVPSNIVWHCYLNAVSRAIAFRTGQEVEPQFMVLRHGGRSALAMFVFSSRPHEFRQIIKLSDRARIRQEAENYRTYVRYYVPLSARLPSTGKAYEADGNIGEIARGTKPRTSRASSGALVSDLVAGSPREEFGPVTFLNKIVELIVTSHTDREVEPEPGLAAKESQPDQVIDEFRSAIKYQFDNNTRRWRNWPGGRSWVRERMNVIDTLREITRIQVKGEENSLERIDHRLTARESDHDRIAAELFEKLTATPYTTVSKIMWDFDFFGPQLQTMDASTMVPSSIIHGDLNARNLVWSQDYVKFFMIDFERVQLGFYGADQLRLVFSMLSDLLVETYQMEKFGPTVSDGEVSRRIQDVGKVAADVGKAATYMGSIALAVKNSRGAEAGSVVIPDPPSDSISAIAIKEIFDTVKLQKETGEFWIYVIVMMAAKQLEYALRDIDESCIEALGRFLDKDPSIGGCYNFYAYYDISELKEGKHDKFVMGKIARALFAYRTLAVIETIQR
jgi:Phosphotransferase enzyme family